MRVKSLKSLLIALFVALSAAGVKAQSGRVIEVTVPFDFAAGAVELKAGDYQVKQLSKNSLLFRSADRTKAVVIQAPISVAALRQDKPERLVFKQYGNQSFLSQIWINRTADGRQLAPSKIERALARQLRESGPGDIAIVARTR